MLEKLEKCENENENENENGRWIKTISLTRAIYTIYTIWTIYTIYRALIEKENSFSDPILISKDHRYSAPPLINAAN